MARLCGHLAAPQPLPKNEIRVWLDAYNKVYCHPPLPDRELEAIIHSIFSRESASEGVIRSLMEKYECGRDAAEELMLQGVE